MICAALGAREVAVLGPCITSFRVLPTALASAFVRARFLSRSGSVPMTELIAVRQPSASCQCARLTPGGGMRRQATWQGS